MSKRRLSPKDRQADLDAYAALESLANYRESNPAFSKANAASAKTAMQTKQTVEVQAKAAYDTARDDAADEEWAFHDVMLNVGIQARAQFGNDSNEVQSLGLKKKSEYKKKTVKPPQA
ncbi:MAG TPA: hypothetical protein VGC76_01970 [Pyrinomonadaceae bacterium]|jgi:hypothetical protein